MNRKRGMFMTDVVLANLNKDMNRMKSHVKLEPTNHMISMNKLPSEERVDKWSKC